MNIARWLESTGKAYPSLPAIGRGSRVEHDYGALAARVARIGGALRNVLSLRPGDRVAIVARNCPEYVELLFAIWHAGLAAVPANAKLHGAELGYIIEHSGARVCFASSGIDAAIAPHAPKSLEHLIQIGGSRYRSLLDADAIRVAPREAGDLAWLFYTSGTTGRPKGAMLSHRSLKEATYAYVAEVDPVSAGDAILHGAPMSHGSGIYIMAHVALGGINVVPESGGFEPDEIFALISRWPRASMFAAPTMIKRLVDSRADCNAEHIRTLIWGGAPMYVEDALKALGRFGPCLAQIYGQGECPMTITALSKADVAGHNHPRWRERLASAGRPYACVDVVVADEKGKPLPAGETGEILCGGDVLMNGYWDNPQASAEALKGGLLHTGDVGVFDADGYLTLKDRSKDLIISGGANIYPREVEEVLLMHERVREVSVIGRPDPEWGEIVVAYVTGSADAAELDALCLSRIARFKRPKDYVFVDALPKNNYGKILKTELRSRDAERARKKV
ncbi:MAG TPA: AMP-binding protein [Pseudolabrys sp.]|nr:AMP-binding protein [Pseudolabrys sp.]